MVFLAHSHHLRAELLLQEMLFAFVGSLLFFSSSSWAMGTFLVLVQHLEAALSIKMYSSGWTTYFIKIIKVFFEVVIFLKKFMDS